MTRITEADHPLLSEFAALREGDRRFTRPAGAGARTVPAFVVEGRLVLDRALASGHVPLAMLFDERHAGQAPPVPAGVQLLCAPVELISTVTGLGVVREVVALFARPPARDARDVLTGATRVLLLEAVANPVNLGVLVRTAAALGMDATLLDGACTDHLYRRAVRGSMGAVLTHPVARIPAAADGVATLHALGWTVLALSPDPGAQPIRGFRAEAGARLALAVGAEGPGLSADVLDAADAVLRIPMAAGVDSLNVAAAAAIACFDLGPAGRSGPPGQ